MTSADVKILVKKQPVGFVCGLVSLIFAGVLYFRSSIIEEKQTEFETTAAEAAKIVSNVGNSKNLAEHVEEIRVLTKDLESRLVSAGQLAVNLQYFYKLEAETEVKLLDIRQNNLPRGSTAIYPGVPFSVTVQGSYKQVMLFLNRLESGRHLCQFKSAAFNKTAGGNNSLQNTMTVALNLELLGQP